MQEKCPGRRSQAFCPVQETKLVDRPSEEPPTLFWEVVPGQGRLGTKRRLGLVRGQPDRCYGKCPSGEQGAQARSSSTRHAVLLQTRRMACNPRPKSPVLALHVCAVSRDQNNDDRCDPQTPDNANLPDPVRKPLPSGIQGPEKPLSGVGPRRYDPVTPPSSYLSVLFESRPHNGPWALQVPTAAILVAWNIFL